MAPSARRLQPSPAPSGTFPLPGSLIDNKYLVEEEIGCGGMGVVVASTHVGLHQRFAIKFLVVGVDDPTTVERFMREARAASELKSEHVVRVSDVGALPSGQPYLVMEYLEGEDLGTVLAERGQLRITEAVGFILQACEAVAEAHSRGIVHRDIKPENLFLTSRSDGTAQIKVVDFGVSKIYPRGESDPNLYVTDGRSMMGSPYYMSPEQVRSTGEVDARSDIWSLGVTLYELITGQRAFDAPTMPALGAKIVADPFTPASEIRPGVPPALDNIIRTCLAKDPALRYRNAAELATALAPFAGSDARIAARRAVRITRQSTADGATVREAEPHKGMAAEVGSSHAALSLELTDDIEAPETADGPKATDDLKPSLDTHQGRRLLAALAALGLLAVALGFGMNAAGARSYARAAHGAKVSTGADGRALAEAEALADDAPGSGASASAEGLARSCPPGTSPHAHEGARGPRGDPPRPISSTPSPLTSAVPASDNTREAKVSPLDGRTP